MREIEALASALSWPFDAPTPRNAATRLLEAHHRDELLEHLYRPLMRRKCWRHALGHLRRAGADLAELSFPTQVFSQSFPVAGRRLWSVEERLAGDRMSLDFLDRLLSEHQRRLRDALVELDRVAPVEYALLTGRALEAHLPDYDERMDFDVDLLAPDHESGFALLESLHGLGYEVRHLRLDLEAKDSQGDVERYEHGHAINIEIDMGGYHCLRGPIWERSRYMDWRGRNMRVVTLEDLLLMLAARTQYVRKVRQVNRNDVAIILRRHGDELDWRYLVDQAVSHGLHVQLLLLTEAAGDLWERDPVPAEARRGLERGAVDRLLVALGRRLDPLPRGGLGRVAARLHSRAARRRGTQEHRPSRSALAELWDRLLYRLELRLGRALPKSARAMTRWPSRLRRNVGSLCELRRETLDPQADFCLSPGVARRRASLSAIRNLAERIPSPGHRPHDCYRFEYHRR